MNQYVNHRQPLVQGKNDSNIVNWEMGLGLLGLRRSDMILAEFHNWFNWQVYAPLITMDTQATQS